MWKKTISVLLLLLATAALWTPAVRADVKADPADAAQRLKKYVTVVMNYDASGLSDREKDLLKSLMEAGRLADEIFWRQTNPDYLKLRADILQSLAADSPVRRYFLMEAGPYDRLDHDAPFLEVPPKPLGAGYYPPDLTPMEFTQHLQKHPEDRQAFMSPYTVIIRENGSLKARPYHEAYRELVAPLAAALRKAAGFADNPSFKDMLDARADGLLRDDYLEADSTWINLRNNKFDLIIGPIEVYDDQLNNLKAAYQASVSVVDAEETQKLNAYAETIPKLQENLPCPPEYLTSPLERKTVFTVVNDIYRGGLLRVGYQAVAVSLPNDPDIQVAEGAKKVFWKNFLEARLEKIIKPIGDRMIDGHQVGSLTWQGFFDVILLHEMAHTLGPKYVRNTEIPINQALRELYSWIEENKADTVGLLSLEYLRDHGLIDPGRRQEHYVGFLASCFRTVRFGTGEGHGLAALVTLNYLLEKGAVLFDKKNGRYTVEAAKFDTAVSQLARELLTIEAEGDYNRARKLQNKYGQLSAGLKKDLDGLADLPVDIAPVFRIKWN